MVRMILYPYERFSFLILTILPSCYFLNFLFLLSRLCGEI